MNMPKPRPKIIITGGTGFIGGYLTDRLCDQYELFCLVKQQPNGSRLSKVRWIEQDLSQPFDYARLPHQIDAVIHLAQSRYYRQFPDRAEDIFKVNVQGTFQLLEYARQAGAERFIFASSGGVYGYSYEKLVETDPVNPLNFYLSSKYAAELLIANYQQFFRTVIFRFFFVYGPGQQGMLMPALLQKVQRGETITVEGNPGLRINPIYIDDAIQVFEPALRLSTSTLFNVAGEEVVTVTEIIQAMEQVTGKSTSIQYTSANVKGDLIGDNSRMKNELKVSPHTALIEGLRRLL